MQSFVVEGTCCNKASGARTATRVSDGRYGLVLSLGFQFVFLLVWSPLPSSNCQPSHHTGRGLNFPTCFLLPVTRVPTSTISKRVMVLVPFQNLNFLFPNSSYCKPIVHTGGQKQLTVGMVPFQPPNSSAEPEFDLHDGLLNHAQIPQTNVLIITPGDQNVLQQRAALDAANAHLVRFPVSESWPLSVSQIPATELGIIPPAVNNLRFPCVVGHDPGLETVRIPRGNHLGIRLADVDDRQRSIGVAHSDLGLGRVGSPVHEEAHG
ncbi:hypothetical protein Mapa_001841 [Marchantia paleacea]|nr:hypothetical protein Mapa_001841 [Marchantia paleacea]